MAHSKIRIEHLSLDTLDMSRIHKRQSYSSEKCRGLNIRLEPNGRKIWYLRYTRPGTEKRDSYDIGDYSSRWNLEAVYEEANRLKKLVRVGHDIGHERKQQQLTEREMEARTLSNVANLTSQNHAVLNQAMAYLDHLKDTKSHKYWKDVESIFRNYLLPEFGARDIRYMDYTEFERKTLIISKQSVGQANKLKRYTCAMFSWLMERELIDHNFLLGRKSLTESVKLPPAERFLNSRQLHSLLNKLPTAPLPDDLKMMLQLLLLSGWRIGEVIHLKWADFRPRERSLQVQILKKRGQAPVTENAILSDAALTLLMNWKATSIERIKAGDEYMFNPEYTSSNVGKLLAESFDPVSPWTSKFVTSDLRKTISTHLEEAGCALELRNLIRRHGKIKARGAAGHYEFGKVDKQKLEWLNRWAEMLDDVKRNPAALEFEAHQVSDDLLAKYEDILDL